MVSFIAFVFFVIGCIGYYRLTRAFFEMRDLLRQTNAHAAAQTELLQTHTRLLAAIANAADPVGPAALSQN
ncbi:MAG TPA: hypothetical protein VGG62_17725 [Terracidiphilus sp.]|jgi:hypothetical protein